ncbi:hypothetical protein DSO57_1026837 [Entomophthora muscae]|uniref:Uncharacterized protein n=1 Tax=Entomophthora muscae TaxID=34485 RepID=A0ACC2S3M0_9FUNG|nr:hypothetical protein DSO57_1026837 [Entomophthora muscae]
MKSFSLLFWASTATAHSWLDCIGLDIPFKGPQQYYSEHFYKDYCIGYPRGYPGRNNRYINDLFTVLVEGRGRQNPNATAICGATGIKGYTKKFPVTRVAAGTRLKLWYEMDNHLNPQTNFHIFGHGKPGKDIAVYNEQKPETKLFTHPFATPENCIDVKMPNTWCWAFWTVPSSWQAGTYSFVWNWPWDMNPIGEEYNTCFDIQVTTNSTKPKCRPRKF